MVRIADNGRDIKAQVEAAVIVEVERIGPTGFNRAPLVERFKDRVPQATLYRWISKCLESGRPGQHIAKLVREAAAERAARTSAPAAELVAATAAMLPVSIGVDDIVGPATGVISVIQEINRCIAIAKKLAAHAETPDGAVRNPKLLVAASEHLRKSLETAVKLQEALRNTEQMGKFIAEVLETIRQVHQESPQVGELLYRRLRALTSAYC